MLVRLALTPSRSFKASIFGVRATRSLALGCVLRAAPLSAQILELLEDIKIWRCYCNVRCRGPRRWYHRLRAVKRKVVDMV